eukprot:INCI4075.15.p2 GENE.INCI4075.15~~INCI4075.15.p2  ORF type:complete len:141 (+),score=20.94 INCI4075.15:1058-1480(+)
MLTTNCREAGGQVTCILTVGCITICVIGSGTGVKNSCVEISSASVSFASLCCGTKHKPGSEGVPHSQPQGQEAPPSQRCPAHGFSGVDTPEHAALKKQDEGEQLKPKSSMPTKASKVVFNQTTLSNEGNLTFFFNSACAP